jgi:hypothetical protein
MRGLDDAKFGWVCFTIAVAIAGVVLVVLRLLGQF